MADSRIDELRTVDPVLTTIARGYTNDVFTAEKLFPTVQVSRLKGKIPVFGRDAFKIRETGRALRAQSNRISPTEFELAEFRTEEQDVETAIDYLEEEESSDFARYEQKIVKDLCDIIKLGKEKATADIVLNTDNYPDAHVRELTSSDTFYNQELIDPVNIINDCSAILRKTIARKPNTIIMGYEVYRAIASHPKVLDRVKYSGMKNVNTTVLKEILEVQNFLVGMAVYANDNNTMTEVWDDSIVIAYTDFSSDRSEFTPSFGYTFQREGMPQIDTYYENGGKIKVIRNTDNYCVKITAPDAGFIITKAIQ